MDHVLACKWREGGGTASMGYICTTMFGFVLYTTIFPASTLGGEISPERNLIPTQDIEGYMFEVIYHTKNGCSLLLQYTKSYTPYKWMELPSRRTTADA